MYTSAGLSGGTTATRRVVPSSSTASPGGYSFEQNLGSLVPIYFDIFVSSLYCWKESYRSAAACSETPDSLDPIQMD